MIKYTHDYVDVYDIETYCQAVRATLAYWLAIHTDPEAWSFDWFLLAEYSGDVRAALKSCRDKKTGQYITDNPTFGFFVDILPTLYHVWAYSSSCDFEQCSICGRIAENGFLDCGCDDGEAEEPDEADLEEWFENVEFGLDSIPISVIEFAILGPMFTEYSRTVGAAVSGSIEEVKESLQMIDASETVEEYITAILWASHVLHYAGSIVDDYGKFCGLDPSLHNRVQEDGLLAEFGSDDVEEYMENWTNPSRKSWRDTPRKY